MILYNDLDLERAEQGHNVQGACKPADRSAHLYLWLGLKWRHNVVSQHASKLITATTAKKAVACDQQSLSSQTDSSSNIPQGMLGWVHLVTPADDVSDTTFTWFVKTPLQLFTLWRPLLPYGYQVKPPFVIVDIRALSRSGLNVRVPGCQQLQMTVWHRMLYSCTHMATVGVKG